MADGDLAMLAVLLLFIVSCALAMIVGGSWSAYLHRPPVCGVHRVEMERRTDWVAFAADVVTQVAGEAAGELAGEIVEQVAGEVAGAFVEDSVERAVERSVTEHVRIRERELWGCPVCDARHFRRKPDDACASCLSCLGCAGLIGGTTVLFGVLAALL